MVEFKDKHIIAERLEIYDKFVTKNLWNLFLMFCNRQITPFQSPVLQPTPD